MTMQDQVGQGQLQIDSKLTQQYRAANPIAGNLIAPLRDASGVLHVFTLGSDGHLYDVYQDPTSDSGWSKVDMKFSGSGTIVCVTAGVEKDGITIVFVADDTGKLYYVRDERWSGWQNFSTITAATVQALKVCHDNSGQLLLAVSSQDQATPGLYWADYTSGNNWGIGNVNPSGSDYWAVTQLNDFQVGLDASANNANGLSIFLAGLCSNVPDGTTYLPAGKKTAWPPTAPPWETPLPDVFWAWNVAKGFSHIALAPNPSKANDFVLFALKGSDCGLYLVDVATQQLQNLSGSVQLAAIAADLDSKAGLSVFGLGVSGNLYNVHQDGGQWTNMMLLNAEMVFLQMSTVKDADGNVMAFAIDSNFNLWQVWRDAATQEWHFVQVDVGTGPMHEFSAYRTQITVQTLDGTAQPNAQIELWSSGLTPAMINGLDVGLNPQGATTARANAAGQVTVVIPADGLDTPTLTVHAGFMEPSERIVIEPNSDIQARLRAVSADDLLHAKNVNGQPVTLLTGNYNTAAIANAVAQSLNQMMAMAGTAADPTDAASRRYLAPKTRLGGARRISLGAGVPPGRIDFARVPDTHWQLDFSSGVPVFSQLTRAEAVARMAQRRATMKSVSDWDWDIDWGEVWDTVTETVVEVADVIVTAVVDTTNDLVTKIEAQVKVVIGEIEALVEASIEFVEQVFEMAEGIFAKVEVLWDELQEWLGFLFDWDDISRTSDVVFHMVGVGLDFVVQATEHAKTVVDTKVDALTNFMQNGMDQFITSFAAQQTVGSVLKSSTRSVPVYDERASNNPLFDAFMIAYSAASPPTRRAKAAAAADSSLQKLLNALQTLAGEFKKASSNPQAAKAFDEAMTYFSSIEQDPDNILQLSLLGMLKLGESVALYALQGLKLLLNLYFDAIQAIVGIVHDLLIEPWDIPIVAELYEYLFDRPFISVGQLFATIIAIPVTSIYKAEIGVAPYPNQNAVNQVTGTLTAAWLGQRAWSGGPQGTALAAPGDADWVNVVRYILNTAYTVNYGIRAVIEGAINADPKPQAVLSYVNWIQRYLSSVFTVPWMFKDTVAPPWPDDADGLENFIWLLQYVCGPLRGAVVLYFEAPGEVGDATLAVWGAAHLGLVSWLADLQAKKEPPMPYLDDWITESVFTCLCPQLLKLLRLPPFPEITLDWSYVVLAGLTFGSEVEIAGFHAERTLQVA